MRQKGHNWIARLVVGALFAVTLILGVVQYRWIGEVSRAERERLRDTLQTSLTRLSQDFSAEIGVAAAALLPERGSDSDDVLGDYAARYEHWLETSSHARLFQTVAVAVPSGTGVQLYRYADRGFVPAEWPAEWADLRREITARANDGRGGRGFPMHPAENPLAFAVPFLIPDRGRRLTEREWLLVSLDPEYLRTTILPEMVTRHVGPEYEAEVTVAADPGHVLLRTGRPIGDQADQTIRIFEPRVDRILRRVLIYRGRGGDRGPEGGPPFDRGRWVLAVRHQEGSLEAVVQHGRIRNIVIVSALLALLGAAIAALVRYTRRAQRLADLQMEFVASVSHELRTPLSVMRTAGHNLQGRVASDPARVRTYGALVEEQSGKLAAIVDQVLSFANANAGRVIAAREPLEVSGIIDEALEGPLADVKKCVPPDLPVIIGDRTTLRHAIRNLVDNALKYGKEDVSIAASASGDTVEIRVEDRGPGIPADELPHLFDPFYRGKGAMENQIHGTGLGLCLTKRIVEAHDGSIRVQSAPGRGTQFVVRLPAIRPEIA